MQLNPHFLFNALNAVAAQVRGGRPDAAVTMLGGLGDLLRYALESSDELLVPLWQELAFLDRYLEIERVRFEDRLEVRVHVPAELHDALVPALLLQPLVENAVRHGIAPRDASGRVEVEAHRDADDLVVAVRDDGVGLGAGDRAAGKTAAGVGLTNTRARLEQLFGDRYALVIAARAGGGVEVEVRVPWKVDGDMS
jgi:LytS/YehU family sensor histidine kinase